MYIRRVVLENIRGFRHLDFTFERGEQDFSGWAVITGDNASGKTALLKAIALALVGPDTTRTLLPSLDGWLTYGQDEGTIAVQLVAGQRDRFAMGGRRYERPFWSELRLARRSDRHTTFDDKAKKRYLRKGKGPTRGPWVEHPEGWFCTGYGPFRRLYGHSPEAQRIMSTTGKVARFATMFREDATLAESDLWVRDLKYRELDGDENSGRILANILSILNYEFLQHDIRVVRVDPDGLWLEHKNGITLALEDMSDGYRSSLAMLIDILRNLIDAYGTDGFKQSEEGHPYLDYSGVALIDEVDAHLHPGWQRRIGEWFKRILPNMQFIVTTHSALVCQAADRRAIYHLPPPGSEASPFQISPEDYRTVVAGRPDTIYLTPIFGLENTRSPRAVEARLRFAKLQGKKRAGILRDGEAEEHDQLKLFIEPREFDEEEVGGASHNRSLTVG